VGAVVVHAPCLVVQLLPPCTRRGKASAGKRSSESQCAGRRAEVFARCNASRQHSASLALCASLRWLYGQKVSQGAAVESVEKRLSQLSRDQRVCIRLGMCTEAIPGLCLDVVAQSFWCSVAATEASSSYATTEASQTDEILCTAMRGAICPFMCEFGTSDLRTNVFRKSIHSGDFPSP
jgi:hypothetical protein